MILHHLDLVRYFLLHTILQYISQPSVICCIRACLYLEVEALFLLATERWVFIGCYSVTF
jgi:hypothetical protein